MYKHIQTYPARYIIMVDKYAIQLYLPASYKISDYVSTLNPNDTSLLIEYGENLLKSHYNTVSIKVSNTQTSTLLQTINDKDVELQNLKAINTHNKIKYKDNMNKLQKQMAIDIETENIKNQALIDLERNKYNSLYNTIELDKENIRNELNAKFLNEIMLIKKECNDYKSLNLQSREIQEIEYNKHRELVDAERAKCYLLHEKINNINNENNNLIDKYKNELYTELKLNRDRDDILLKTQLENEQTNTKLLLNQMEHHHNIIVSGLNDRIMASENTLKDKEKCLFDVAKIVKYYDFQDTATKGSNGENKIQEIIKSYYNESIIVDTSGTAHSGDLLFTLSNLKCLIEVKNKKHITEGDISKFLSDVENNSKEINCALFISLISSNIPTKGNFYIEIKNSLPIIYIYTYDNSSILFAIETLVFLTNKFINITKKSRTEQQLSDETIALIYNNFNTMKYESDRINGIIIHLEKQIAQLKISKKNLNGRVNNIKDFYNKYEKLEPINEKENALKKVLETEKKHENSNELDAEKKPEYTTEELEKLNAWIIEKKQIPTKPEIMSILKLSRYEVNKRGTTTLRKKLKLYYFGIPSSIPLLEKVV